MSGTLSGAKGSASATWKGATISVAPILGLTFCKSPDPNWYVLTSPDRGCALASTSGFASNPQDYELNAQKEKTKPIVLWKQLWYEKTTALKDNVFQIHILLDGKPYVITYVQGLETCKEKLQNALDLIRNRTKTLTKTF